MLTGANTTCPDCGEYFTGDGYKVPLVCGNRSHDSDLDGAEPDSGPWPCGKLILGRCPIGKVLLTEGELDPDAAELFDDRLLEEYGLGVLDFIKQEPIYYHNEETVQYHYMGYALEYSADNPAYRLKSGVIPDVL